MKILLVTSSIIFPIVMFFLQSRIKLFRIIFNIIAVISALIFGNIAATSIYQILIDNTVFMTAIHSVFLNPYFLITGAYLGLFLLYRLIILTLDES
ncbi:transposase [Metabacillus fastidiosus]|uniref:Transposase n=1 Tax=Metabacillus fastidiosus TaxID=1458 RepID=A0ABU6P0K8_9BACI|nr:transposase [Metabacillus fastidiosus]MED4402483.1 transposase [Metabacillus fastidiosus]MED4453834.1 transposase [Metabacillus fastidiosus]MED4461770.1 transposase [Metabacillus fastidiosus]